ncbi:MAG: 30S ribosomal protein S19 [candidate division WS6 bacterium OLB20]|uniref:Small ribosomal subunit protein uS19 n=1 Tax=candidate division WS6 bacterium OLB20 TaxID=1617426 RepID=A0A136LX03_9BACT|nr:MAG: 30S ribosomal protein S19 [candidate division WS6 bacterium OLB20]
MSRSSKKGPYVNEKLLKKIAKQRATGKNDAIRTWARSSSISPEMVGLTFDVHAGKEFIKVFVTESMVGHKLGEFAPTRKFRGHSRKGKIAKSSGTAGRVLSE